MKLVMRSKTPLASEACTGQFIGLRPNSWPSMSMQNMFSLYFAACPDVCHRCRLYLRWAGRRYRDPGIVCLLLELVAANMFGVTTSE